MKKIKILVFGSLLFLIIIAIYFIVIINTTTIYRGVRVKEIELGGKTRTEAIEYLYNHLEKNITSKKLILHYEDYSYTVSFSDMGVSYDYFKAADNAFLVGRKGSFIKRLKEIFSARFYGREIDINIKYDIKKINLVKAKISKEINRQSKNAEIRYKKGRFQITPEVIGVVVDNKELEKNIIEALHNYKYSINIPVKEENPSVTEKMLKEIKDEIGEFSTSFKGSSVGRVHNIKLAASSISDRLVLPGEVFSFNKATGLRSEDTGYKEAKVIVNGKYVDDIGGGVCQVSTTLYNAALMSDLEIVERYPHSIPSTYVPHGRDATVVYDYLDLKFRNNSKYPIYIYAEARNNNLNIKLFGKKEDKNKIIKLSSKIIEKIEPEYEVSTDNSLKPGEKIIVEEGRYGYKVETYKMVYENRKLIEKKLISVDFYKPKKYIIKVGPKENEIENKNPNEELNQ